MGGEDSLSCGKGINMLIEVLYLLMILVRDTETSGVRNIANSCSCLRNGINNSGKILIVSTTSILRIELHIFHIPLRILHGSHGTLDNLLWSGVELIAYMAFRSANASMYSLMLRILKCFCCHINILFYCTCECTDGWPCHGLTDFYYTIEIAWAGDRESRLYDVYSQRLKLLCDLNFLYCVQLTSWYLLAVAEGGVKNK